jgi:hypothetical protein
MERYYLKTILGNYDYEVIEHDGEECVATVSKHDGKRYLEYDEIPKGILWVLKKCGYKIALYDARKLNSQLGLDA